MGGAVSSGRDNNELIDNLMGGNYIRTRAVERVFRVLDRADYMTPEARDQAYKDLAWRNGPLHMSAPCIYSEVLEGLELKPGLSFLNIGSGTGYFSTLVGLIIGSGGINHGVEVHPYVLEYALKKLSQFIENSPTLDEFDFCEPKFYGGNGLCLAPLQAPYDRVYCGAACPEQYHNYFKQLIKVGGVLVMPLNDNLVQIKRTCIDGWSSRNLLNVSFATLRVPTKEEASDLLKLEEQCPPRLQVLSRAVVRAGMRASLLARHPHLREPPPRRPQPPNSCPRRICIPIEDDSDVEGLNALHDLDHVNGANEMNALLSLVLSMGQNRVAGALRFDSLDSPSSSSSSSSSSEDGEDGDGDADDGDDGDSPARTVRPIVPRRPYRPSRPRPDQVERSERSGSDNSGNSEQSEHSDGSNKSATADKSPKSARFGNLQLPAPIRTHRGLITFEFQGDGKNGCAPQCDGTHNIDTKDEKAEKSEGTDSNDTKKGSEKMKGVPAEVEIYLGKDVACSSRTEIEWQHTTETKRASSSEEDTVEISKEKRKKLDSGIGEGTTTSSGSSPVKTESNEGEESEPAEEHSDNNMSEDEQIGGRRRRQKRGRCALGARSLSASSRSGASGGSARGSPAARRRKRRAHGDAAAHARALDELRPRRGQDARRVRLSILMKRGVKQLPLPYALKKYVNLGRCFEF